MNPVRRAVYGVALTVVVAAVTGIGGIVWHNARGVEAILELCKARGGLRIAETAEADGYLDLQDGYTCLACMQYLGRRQYSYVDFHTSTPTPLSDRAGYQRMTVASRDDPGCARYERAVSVGNVVPGERYGLRADECFVVTPLDQRPVGFTYGRRYGTVEAPNGVSVASDELYVADERNARELAVSRNYLYFAPFAALLDMSGGGGVSHTTCDQTAGVPFEVGIVGQVLLKKSKSEATQGAAQ